MSPIDRHEEEFVAEQVVTASPTVGATGHVRGPRIRGAPGAAAATPSASGLTQQDIDDAIDAHELEADPHAAYATDADLTTHEGAADPHTGYQKESEKAAANGYASLDASTKVPIAQIPTGTSGTTVALGNAVSTHEAAADPHTAYQRESEKGAASGYASLDASTKVPIAEVPTGTTSSTVSLGNHTHSAPTFSGASVYNSASQSVSNGSAILFDSEEFDTASYHSTASNTGRLTVPTTGYYLVIAIFEPATADSTWELRRDGATALRQFYLSALGNSAPGAPVSSSHILSLSATQYIEIINRTGASVTVDADASQLPRFEIALLGT